jgi:CRP-like cAMP-binding protein
LVEFDDGDTIITQGEEGNDFYIIMKGKKMMKYLF